MTGAKLPTAVDDRTLGFMLPQGMAKNRATRITVELTQDDLYAVRFWKMNRRAMKLDLISEHLGIYYDMLREVFEHETGLATRL